MIYDATNINYKKRRAFIQKLNKLDVKKIAIMVATPYEECLERNASRERKVPEEVIKRMYYNFYVPQYYEGFDDIQIRYNSEYVFRFEELQDISQDNPHHTLSVLEHCDKTCRILYRPKISIRAITENFTPLDEFELAGLLHDIGKLKTKTFVNAKGETTEIAHYYSHEKVGAYDSLFCTMIKTLINGEEVKEALYTIKLIQWHMLLHFNLSEKSKIKYKNMLGEKTWEDLYFLHKADCEAR